MNFITRMRDQFLPKYGASIGLGLLIVFVLAGNLNWIRQDTAPSRGVDANLYMLQTLMFVDGVVPQGQSQTLWSFADLSLKGRPPLYQLMSVPFVLLFGRSMDSGLYVNMLFEILLLVAVYNIGKLAENGRAGLLAAIIVAGYPPLISLARVYRPHFAMAACVALTAWLLYLLQKKRSIKIIWLFGLSLAFGLWIHPFFLWVAPIPAAVVCLYMVFILPSPPQMSLKQLPAWLLGKVREPLVLFGLLPASIVSIAFVLTWYLTRGAIIFNMLTSINSPERIELRGFKVFTIGFSAIQPSFGWYVVTSPHAISTVFVALLEIGMVAGLIKRQCPDLILLILFVVGYTLLSLQGTLGWRYFAPLLPIAAALTGIWIGRLKNQIVSSILILLCIATTVFNFAIVTWGRQPWNQSMATVLGVPRDTQSENCWPDIAIFCPLPPDTQNWPINDILGTVLEDAACKRDICKFMIINQSEFLDESIFAYYLVQNFPEMPVSTLSPGYQGLPLRLPDLLNSDYLVYEDATNISGNVSYAAAVIRMLQSPPPAFASAHKQEAEFILPNGNVAKLIKRIKPLTMEEAETTIAAIDIPDKSKILQYKILAPLYAEAGNLVKSISYYEQALKYTQDSRIRFEYLLEMGRMNLSLGRAEDAAGSYQEALKLNKDPRARLGLGMAYAAQGLTDAAIREFKKIIQNSPRSEYAHQAQEWLDNHK